MDTLWLQNIICDENEYSKLHDWIKYIGKDRLKKIYEIARGELSCVTYYQMTECAKYDARVSQWLFKTIRVVEGHMRAMLLNHTDCYDTLLSIKEIENRLPKILSPNYADKDIGVVWNQLIKKLKRTKLKTFTIAEILDICAFSELGRLHSVLTDDEIYDGCVFKGREAKARDLGIINQLRNAISHNHLVVNSSINYKNELFTLKRQIEILLSYIEDKDMRLRRAKELNGYATYPRDGILMEIPEHYRIVIGEQ